MSELVLLRGQPGAGKSTFAAILARQQFLHVEADHWMVNERHEYEFNPSSLNYCHQQCLERTKTTLARGRNVVVANTFSKLWELEPYLQLGYRTTVLHVEGNFDNVHGVSKEKVQEMKDKYAPYKG